MNNTPNHICKNPRCHKGDDEGAKHYWACNDCDKQNSWRKAACDEECYVEYLDILAVERGGIPIVTVAPDQISFFDELVAGDVPTPDEPVVEEQTATNTTPSIGYYNKKNKHR